MQVREATSRVATSEARLVEASLQGDREAFGSLLKRHQAMVVAVCTKILGDHAMAEDSFQEATITSWLRLDQLKDPTRFGAWLTGIAINICKSWIRQKEPTWSLDAVLGGVAHQIEADTRMRPDEIVEAMETSERITSAIRELPEGQRTAVLLFYTEGLTHREVAVLLQTSPSAVKTRLQKARAVLRRKLGEEVAMSKATAIPMKVVDVRGAARAAQRPLHVVILAEKEGGRRLPIFVGENEGNALALELEGVETVRPLTFSFMADLVKATGARIKEVRIERLHESTFFATVVVETAKGTREVDARPSDALTLALALDAPISADSEVLEAATVSEDWTAMVEALPEPEEGKRGSVEIVDRVKQG